jgi:hypothetical protein
MRYTNFSNIFWNSTLHVSDSLSVCHWESRTVHTALGRCHTGYAVPVWHLPNAVCTVLDSRWRTERLSETCKVLFQNKFEKFVHLIGLIIGVIYSFVYFLTLHMVTICFFIFTVFWTRIKLYFVLVKSCMTSRAAYFWNPHITIFDCYFKECNLRK